MSQNRKKRPLTLIEILIAMGLTAIIFTFILTTFFQHIRLSKKIENAKEIVLTRTHMQEHLTDIFFPSIVNSILPFFIQPPKTLCFQFDNGIDPNRNLSGLINGDLYLKNSNLCLKITCPKNSGVFREEILLTHVQSIDFEFYDSQTDENAMNKKTFWEKGKKQRPLFFILKVNLNNNKEIAFPFCTRIEEKGLTFSK